MTGDGRQLYCRTVSSTIADQTGSRVRKTGRSDLQFIKEIATSPGFDIPLRGTQPAGLAVTYEWINP